MGNVTMIQSLLNSRLPSNITDESKVNDTLLHWAVSFNHIDVVKLLLEYNADLNAPNTDGHTPLHIACKHYNLEIIELLLLYGADCHNYDLHGHSPKDLLLSSSAAQVNSATYEHILALMNRPALDKHSSINQHPPSTTTTTPYATPTKPTNHTNPTSNTHSIHGVDVSSSHGTRPNTNLADNSSSTSNHLPTLTHETYPHHDTVNDEIAYIDIHPTTTYTTTNAHSNSTTNALNDNTTTANNSNKSNITTPQLVLWPPTQTQKTGTSPLLGINTTGGNIHRSNLLPLVLTNTTPISVYIDTTYISIKQAKNILKQAEIMAVLNKLGFRLILYTSTYTTDNANSTTHTNTTTNNKCNTTTTTTTTTTTNKQDNNNIHIKNSKIRIYINNIICNKQNSYNINITHEYIILYVYDIIGILYGLQTLTQIIELHSEITTKHTTTTNTTYNTTYTNSNNSNNNMYNIPYISIYIPSITIQDHPDTYVYRSILWSETQFFALAMPVFRSNLKLLLKCRINMLLLKIKPNTIYNNNTSNITTNTINNNSNSKERIEMCSNKYIQIVPSYTYTSPHEVYTPYTPLIHTTNNSNNNNNNSNSNNNNNNNSSEKCSVRDLIALHFLYDINNVNNNNKAHTSTTTTTTTTNHTTSNNNTSTNTNNSTHPSTEVAAAGLVETEIGPVDSTTYEHDCLHACHAVLVGVYKAGFRSVLMHTNEWTRRVAGPHVSSIYIYMYVCIIFMYILCIPCIYYVYTVIVCKLFACTHI